MFELICHEDTGPHGMTLKLGDGNMIPFQMKSGESIKISGYRQDSPGIRFIYDGCLIRNFDYNCSIYGIKKRLLKTYRKGDSQ